MKEPRFLAGLNPQQREAVTHGQEPLLILAGAGSGKTRVITCRIAYLIKERGFFPGSILAVTFTNKAANEMRERVLDMVPEARGVMIRTFHSFGAWLLRRYGSLLGLKSTFTIYDDDDQTALLGQVLEGTPRQELRGWARRVSRAKDSGLGPQDDLGSFTANPDFPEIYQKYETRLREIGNVDFGDLIRLPAQLLQQDASLREKISRQYQVILVDEYQDTNLAQYQLLQQLTAPDTAVAVVGDDDQSIYRFRGAEVENILTFSQHFPGTKTIKLEQNYRSTGTILDVAAAVVAHNKDRLGKKLWSDKGPGEKTRLVYLDNHEAEAEWCAQFVDADGNFGGTAILYRTNAQSRAFETCFRRWNIPYRLVGTISFYQREEVKDVLSYLSFLANGRDEVAVRRIANKPPRGLGKVSLNRLITSAMDRHQGDIAQSCQASPPGLQGKAQKGAAFLGELWQRYQEEGEFEHLGFLIQDLIMHSGLLEHYREIDKLEHSQRTQNLEELVAAAVDYPANPEGLAAFLELVELDRALLEEEESDKERVTLITMHNTKGLEFDRVIITGLEEGLFPRGDDEDEEEIEEERRLFYVAITRARKTLVFTNCRQRMIWGRFRDSSPSRFLREIPSELVTVEGEGQQEAAAGDPWQRGVKIYHDEYGVGFIQKRLLNGGHRVIHVLFESGRRATILPEFSAHKMEVLGTEGNDW